MELTPNIKSHLSLKYRVEISCQPVSRASRDGQTIHENTTVSFSSHLTAIGSDVTSPSFTSPPQFSTILSAPCSLKTVTASSACSMYFFLLTVVTATAECYPICRVAH